MMDASWVFRHATLVHTYTRSPTSYTSFDEPIYPSLQHQRSQSKPWDSTSETYRTHFTKENVHLHFTKQVSKKRFTTHVKWSMSSPCSHTVDLYHGVLLGSRDILVDGERIIHQHKLLDDGSQHHFKVDGHDVCVAIVAKHGHFQYHITVDGEGVEKVWL